MTIKAEVSLGSIECPVLPEEKKESGGVGETCFFSLRKVDSLFNLLRIHCFVPACYFNHHTNQCKHAVYVRYVRL